MAESRTLSRLESLPSKIILRCFLFAALSGRRHTYDAVDATEACFAILTLSKSLFRLVQCVMLAHWHLRSEDQMDRLIAYLDVNRECHGLSLRVSGRITQQDWWLLHGVRQHRQMVLQPLLERCSQLCHLDLLQIRMTPDMASLVASMHHLQSLAVDLHNNGALISWSEGLAASTVRHELSRHSSSAAKLAGTMFIEYTTHSHLGSKGGHFSSHSC